MTTRGWAVVWMTIGLAVPAARAVLLNAWHIPYNQEVPSGDFGTPNTYRMRTPFVEVGTNAVTIYQGVYKGGGDNQTGGALIWRVGTNGAWNTNSLSFFANMANQNQFWRATITPGTNGVVQYFVRANSDNRDTTYLYEGDLNGNTFSTASEATARANPYSFRNRPAWIFHAGNRVVQNATNVQFWAKSGYIGKDGSLASRFSDRAAIYYTTNGSTPSGTNGVSTSAATVAVPMSFANVEGDNSAEGNAMWWAGTASNLPPFAVIKYRIGFWNSATVEEKFADFNTGSNDVTYSFQLGSVGDPVLTVNGVNANYTTSHLFVNELASDSVPLTVVFEPGVANLTDVEVYSNLNRRDFATADANGDGVEDGIRPPSGDTVNVSATNTYYRAYTMTNTGTVGRYALVLPAQKTGAYRLTARYRTTGNSNWTYYSTFPRRDHAIVVSPKSVYDMVMYEANTLNLDALGTLQGQRSTFVDLWDGPGAANTNAWNLNSRLGVNFAQSWNLDYAKALGVNWLWFQPVHPNGIDGRQIDPDTGLPFEVGSPYAVKNFFEVMPLMSQGNTRSAALVEFTNFVQAADTKGVNVMLDAPFNHTAYDAELAASGVFYFSSNSTATTEIRNAEARFYSRVNAYDMRASSSGNIAVAPDRGDFGKFADTYDVFWGRYAALVEKNPDNNGDFNNEEDWFDYSIGNENSSGDGNGHFDTITQNVWRYFSDYLLYWLDKTGCPAGTPAGQADKGIDGLRADFGQGMPPQAWEYIVNKTRARKWNFIFMAESLDGGAVTYRSNRHFDILNENITFGLQAASTASDYRNIYESRRNAYGLGLVLLNSTSHDEANYADPFEAMIRYAVNNTVDGVPLIFPGQELGISGTFGYDRYELNFGKYIPHFKKFNSLQPVLAHANRTYGLDQLWHVFSAIGQARQFSPALRSINRYFLDQTGGGGPQPKIFSVAKYEEANGNPAARDVVFAFVNLNRNADEQGNFNLNITQNGSNLFGIQSGRSYNVKNIAATLGVTPGRRDAFVWSPAKSGSDLLTNGLFVQLKRVPTADAAWATAPYEAQYLKLYDVTPPPAPLPLAPYYVIGTNASFTWVPNGGPQDVITNYVVSIGTTVGGSNVVNAAGTPGTNVAFTGTYGTVYYATLRAVSSAGVSSTNAGSSDAGSPNPASPTTPVILLDPAGDQDGDTVSNAQEAADGTNPLNPSSLLLAPVITQQPAGTNVLQGGNATFTVAAVGTAPLAYQWARNNGALPGETNTTLSLTGVTTNAAGTYTVTVTNALGSATSTGAVLVVEVPNQAPVLSPVGNRTVNAGVTVVVTNSATDDPAQTLTFSLPVAPAGATLGSSNGVFSWRPPVAQAGQTHPVTVVVTDNGAPPLSATQSFSIIVNALSGPVATPATGFTNGLFGMTVSGDLGPDYSVEASSNLLQWSTVYSTNAPALPFFWADPDTTNFPSRFYRIRLSP